MTERPTAAEQASGHTGTHRARHSGELSRSAERTAFAVLLFLCAALYLLYFAHFRADYPAVLPGIDWSRYTDEGWYTGAALRSVQTGRWFVPNGFNPAVALPLWPLLARLWFGIAGVGMVQARVLAVLCFGGSCLLLFALLRPLAGRVLAAGGMLLLLANPFCFGFERMAILEPLAGFLLLLALWTARPQTAPISLYRSAAAGLLITAMVFTKTTAVFAAPAILYLLWQAARTHRHDPLERSRSSLVAVLRRAARDTAALRKVAVAVLTAAATWLLYFLALVRPHHLPDYLHLFAVNAGKAHGRILLQVMARALGDGTWMGGLLYALMLLLLTGSLRFVRELWRIPLFGSAVLALVLPIAFIGWHTWFLPHYYLPCVAPAVLVVVLGVHALSRRAHASTGRRWRLAHTVAMVWVEAAFAVMLMQTLSTALHPHYTWSDAARSMSERIGAEPGHSASLLAASADDVALWTGIRPVNSEWPIGGLPALLQQEKPGWYGGYLPWDADRIAHMQTMLPLNEVARYAIQPDSSHRVFVLYRVRTAPENTVSR